MKNCLRAAALVILFSSCIQEEYFPYSDFNNSMVVTKIDNRLAFSADFIPTSYPSYWKFELRKISDKKYGLAVKRIISQHSPKDTSNVEYDEKFTRVTFFIDNLNIDFNNSEFFYYDKDALIKIQKK